MPWPCHVSCAMGFKTNALIILLWCESGSKLSVQNEKHCFQNPTYDHFRAS